MGVSSHLTSDIVGFNAVRHFNVSRLFPGFLWRPGILQAGKAALLLPVVLPTLPPALRRGQCKFISHRLHHRLLLSGISPRGTNP